MKQRATGGFQVETTAAQAVEQLIQEYGKLVFHVIFGLTNDWQESQDLTQETFLLAFRNIEAARKASEPQFQAKAWLLQIAVNTTRMFWRRRTLHALPFSALQSASVEERFQGEAPASHEEIPGEDDPGTLIAERDLVQRCLKQLSEAYRIPLLLSIVAGFSSQEIARMLGLQEATVRQRLVRARKAFQVAYRQESGEQLLAREHAASTTRYASRSADRLGHRPAALLPMRL
jgi:RNA polymerase sigma-70 factor (ECF subfamily)